MFTLACTEARFFDDLGNVLLILTIVKPLTYMAFVAAFRYRTTRSKRLDWGTIISIAVALSALGILVLVGAFWILEPVLSQVMDADVAGWLIVGVERFGSWSAIGLFWAGLRGRRLAGWTISGAAIDLAYDWTIDQGFAHSQWHHVTVAIISLLFIGTLFAFGHRVSLKRRFGAPGFCRECGYDLAGLNSGRCPECGNSVGTAPSSQTAGNVGAGP